MQQPTHDDPDDLELTATSDAALRRLRRPAWPDHPPDFGEPLAHDPSADIGCSITASMHNGLVAARRFTCALSRERFDGFSAPGSHRRTLVVHALDAAPSLPLLWNWAVANADLLAAFRIRAHAELKCDVLFVMPDDVPPAFRERLASVGVTRWVTPRYPAGNWRLMPMVAGTPIDHTLTLDTIAAVDLAHACERGVTPAERPVAFDAGPDRPPRFVRATRGATLAEMHDSDSRWLCGPALALHPVEGHYMLGDGELAFYRDDVRTESMAATACVRCGNCVSICPTHCDPVALLAIAAKPNRRAAARAGLDACIDCGLCTAACPAAIPLHVLIDSLRRGLPAREQIA